MAAWLATLETRASFDVVPPREAPLPFYLGQREACAEAAQDQHVRARDWRIQLARNTKPNCFRRAFAPNNRQKSRSRSGVINANSLL